MTADDPNAGLGAVSGNAVAFILEWLDVEADGPAWARAETDRQQLSLFG